MEFRRYYYMFKQPFIRVKTAICACKNSNCKCENSNCKCQNSTQIRIRVYQNLHIWVGTSCLPSSLERVGFYDAAPIAPRHHYRHGTTMSPCRYANGQPKAVAKAAPHVPSATPMGGGFFSAGGAPWITQYQRVPMRSQYMDPYDRCLG